MKYFFNILIYLLALYSQFSYSSCDIFFIQSTVETFGSSLKRKLSKLGGKRSQKTSTSEPPKIEIEEVEVEVELEPLENLNVQELPDVLVKASSHSSVETQNSAPPVTNQQESLGLTLVLKYFQLTVYKNHQKSLISTKNDQNCARKFKYLH